jgi:leader peptidase (prepilin peptidase) / N-methyltransferase
MMTASWPIDLLMAPAGLVIGSFLNVVIYRVPRRQSIVFPGSHCPSCDVPIKGRHNVPVLSWLALRARCHACNDRISARYPLVEGGTALLFAATTERFGLTAELPAYLFLAALGVALALIDLDMRHLPDVIVLPSYIISVLLLMPAGAVNGDWWSAARGLAGMFALLFLFFALTLAYPMGLGFSDVKLAGMLGLYLGWLSWWALFLAAIGAFLIAGAARALVVATKQGTRAMTIPLGPCLIGAAVLSVLVAAPISTWYGSLITV